MSHVWMSHVSHMQDDDVDDSKAQEDERGKIQEEKDPEVSSRRGVGGGKDAGKKNLVFWKITSRLDVLYEITKELGSDKKSSGSCKFITKPPIMNFAIIFRIYSNFF